MSDRPETQHASIYLEQDNKLKFFQLVIHFVALVKQGQPLKGGILEKALKNRRPHNFVVWGEDTKKLVGGEWDFNYRTGTLNWKSKRCCPKRTGGRLRLFRLCSLPSEVPGRGQLPLP